MNNNDRLLKHIQINDGLGYDQNEILQTIISRTEDGDCEQTAEKLLKKFKSFNRVVNADLQELMQVGRIKEETARGIKSIAVYSRLYMSSLYNSDMRVFNTESAYSMMKDNFFGRQHEFVGMMILDREGHTVYNDIIAQTRFTAVPSYIRRAISLCLKYEGDTVIFAHNHPAGTTIPSREEIVAARELQLAFESIYVTLFDSLIITDRDYSSLKSAGIIRSITDEVRSFKENLFYRNLVLDPGQEVLDFGRKLPGESNEDEDIFYDYSEGDFDDE
ncbi:MAG: JAB domain-containing protein [Clostridia bacterium]|nr:JAB domain-containing protein [Clostridia bacterium]